MRNKKEGFPFLHQPYRNTQPTLAPQRICEHRNKTVICFKCNQLETLLSLKPSQSRYRVNQSEHIQQGHTYTAC